MNNEKGQAKSFNEGKNMLDLISPFVEQEIGKVYTFGAGKYGRSNHQTVWLGIKLLVLSYATLTLLDRGEGLWYFESGLLHYTQWLEQYSFSITIKIKFIHKAMTDHTDTYYKIK